MKKAKYYIGIIILIAGVLAVGSEKLFGINILTATVIDDAVGPAIETTLDVNDGEVTVTLKQGETFDLGSLSCDDDHDFFCDVKTIGEYDKDKIGSQVIVIQSIDTSGNESTIKINITVLDPNADYIDPSLYIPTGYYDSIDGLTGEELKAALNDIITNHTEFPYTSTSTDVWDIMKEADEDPENPDNVIMFYSGFSWPKACQDTVTPPELCRTDVDGESKLVEWNREHIWSKSRGDFGTSVGAGTDLHHLVAAERNMNSTKNNRHYEDCNDGDDTNIVDRGYGNYTCNDWEFEPRDEVKGDVARMIFYMAVRYEGEIGDMVDLEVVNDPDSSKESKLPVYGDLNDLLRWHIEDPVSEWEINRNQVIFTYQGNRNPFIDDPDLVFLVFGTPTD